MPKLRACLDDSIRALVCKGKEYVRTRTVGRYEVVTTQLQNFLKCFCGEVLFAGSEASKVSCFDHSDTNRLLKDERRDRKS